jgi:K+-transporting ATPase ATPase C chain
MLSQIRPAIASFIILTVITGVLYPAAVTIAAKAAFRHQAEGSIIEKDGKAVGSELIAQGFTQPKYFWPRQSATTPAYNGQSSGASNLGPRNPALVDAVTSRIAALKAADPGNRLPVPIDLVTASASGLDPDISLEAAEYQISRVAKARGMSEDAVRKLALQATEPRPLGIFGEPVVNVLELNLMLDKR